MSDITVVSHLGLLAKWNLSSNNVIFVLVCRLNEEQDEPSSPTLASVPLIHNIPELKVSQEVCV